MRRLIDRQQTNDAGLVLPSLVAQSWYYRSAGCDDDDLYYYDYEVDEGEFEAERGGSSAAICIHRDASRIRESMWTARLSGGSFGDSFGEYPWWAATADDREWRDAIGLRSAQLKQQRWQGSSLVEWRLYSVAHNRFAHRHPHRNRHAHGLVVSGGRHNSAQPL